MARKWPRQFRQPRMRAWVGIPVAGQRPSAACTQRLSQGRSPFYVEQVRTGRINARSTFTGRIPALKAFIESCSNNWRVSAAN
ncbi:unnamed protein product, partial [Iphiclides podalirius]